MLHFLLSSTLSFAVGVIDTLPTEYREYDFNAVGKIILNNTAGRIHISPMDGQKILITATKRQFGERCRLYIAKEYAVQIVLRVEHELGENCEVDFDLRVPKEINLEVSSGSGNVTIDGVSGDLHFDMGSGKLLAAGQFKHLKGKTGSGEVDVSGLAGAVDLSVGSGKVKLGFAEDPKGDVQVRTGSGDATLLFPKGSKIKTAFQGGSGSLLNEIADSSRPELNVSVTAGSGNLKIKTY
jgi:hypothetical protein